MTTMVCQNMQETLTFLYVCCALPVLDLTDQLYYLQSKSVFLGDFFAVDILFIFIVLPRMCVQQFCLIHRFVCHGFANSQKNIVSTFVHWGAVLSLDKLAIRWGFLQVLRSLPIIIIHPIIHTHDFGLYGIGSAPYLITSLALNTCRFCQKHQSLSLQNLVFFCQEIEFN